MARFEAEIVEMERRKDKERREENERTARLKIKKRKKQHWEILRWVVAFLEDNRENWNELKRRRGEDEAINNKYENWKRMNTEKKTLIEGQRVRKEHTKEERLELAKEKKRAWK